MRGVFLVAKNYNHVCHYLGLTAAKAEIDKDVVKTTVGFRMRGAKI